MVVYAVIDTNVLVSAILAAHPNSATVIIREKIMDGTIVPLYNGEIVDEYQDVLSRPKFHFPIDLVTSLLNVIRQKGICLERTKTEEIFTDSKDVVFYEIALSKEGAYLVTGNTKYFPATPIVVTPAELLRIIESMDCIPD